MSEQLPSVVCTVLLTVVLCSLCVCSGDHALRGCCVRRWPLPALAVHDRECSSRLPARRGCGGRLGQLTNTELATCHLSPLHISHFTARALCCVAGGVLQLARVREEGRGLHTRRCREAGRGRTAAVVLGSTTAQVRGTLRKGSHSQRWPLPRRPAVQLPSAYQQHTIAHAWLRTATSGALLLIACSVMRCWLSCGANSGRDALPLAGRYQALRP